MNKQAQLTNYFFWFTILSRGGLFREFA